MIAEMKAHCEQMKACQKATKAWLERWRWGWRHIQKSWRPVKKREAVAEHYEGVHVQNPWRNGLPMFHTETLMEERTRSARTTEDWFGHQQLAVGYHKQLKRQTQDDCEPLQKIATAIQ
jgi:hypothetical protein